LSLSADQLTGPKNAVGNPVGRRPYHAGIDYIDETRFQTLESSNEQLAWWAGHDSDESRQKNAFDELFRRLWRGTVEWARSFGARTQDQAEDAATQAWLRAWRYRHRYDPGRAHYGTWLGAIVRNETLDVVRAESRHQIATPEQTSEPEPADPWTEDEPGWFALSYVWEAFEALGKAKPDFAAALSLKAEGYRDKQICARLGIEKIGTVGSRLFRAKKFMADWLAGRGVVFLPDHTVGRVHPWGLHPLCRAGGGIFYSFSPLDGLFVLPADSAPPPRAIPVCDGFFVRVWSYPLQRFWVVTSDQDRAHLPQPIFKWNQYLVLDLQDGPPQPVA
jgi:RNA polymerase sigma factor (sigma-70 family)